MHVKIEYDPWGDPAIELSFLLASSLFKLVKVMPDNCHVMRVSKRHRCCPNPIRCSAGIFDIAQADTSSWANLGCLREYSARAAARPSG
jgi:hypothetical protein